ncbi:Hypothetical protein A7982_08103 [Minicystis rosea]|nr:Hypothetical protein A7982_08103 [Minicystis rosea]
MGRPRGAGSQAPEPSGAAGAHLTDLPVFDPRSIGSSRWPGKVSRPRVFTRAGTRSPAREAQSRLPASSIDRPMPP